VIRYGVRVNAIAPAARTRLTLATPGVGDQIQPPAEPGRFDVWSPANISPLVAWLGTEGCTVTGKVFYVQGGKVAVFQPWTIMEQVEKDDRWSIAELDEAVPKLLASLSR